MLHRSHIEKFLQINGIKTTAPDEEIKSVLLSAHWHKDDVEAAVLVLRENLNTHKTHVDSLHKVFRTDDRLRPETISSLLGIEMNVTSADISRDRHSRASIGSRQLIIIALSALIGSLLFAMISMWYLEMGIFHQTLR